MRLLLLTVFFLAFAPKILNAQTRWTSFSQLDSLEKVENRPVLVFITAPWCMYCKAMKRTTFRNKKVEAELNRNFYVLELDAEKDQTLSFNGRTYRFRPNGNQTGLQELAVELGRINGQMSYPTLVFLRPGQEGKLAYPAYATAKELLKMTAYVRAEKTPVK